MFGRFIFILAVAAIIIPFSFVGCKGKVDKSQEIQLSDMGQDTAATQMTDTLVTTEPAQMVATETIPPTAAPEIAQKPVVVKSDTATRNKDIQVALKNAGLYTGAIDGKIGPKTKKAIEEFQKARGLKVDGKVGPKTWAELEKYLVQQTVQQ